MFRVALVAVGVQMACAVSWRSLSANDKKLYTFTDFKEEYNKKYATAAAELEHKTTFDRKLDAIHNQNAKAGLAKRWTAGVNKFTDLSSAEMDRFKGYRPSYRPPYRRPSASTAAAAAAAETPYHAPPVVFPALPPGAALPESIDWRALNATTPVKNQGGCGSCWAFSATETIESAVAIATGSLLTLAPQELVDCVTNPDECGGSGGCGGATQELAYAYAMLTGMSKEADYPYQGQDGQCKMGGERSVGGVAIAAGIKGYVKLPVNNNTALLTALATVGPVAISVDASFGSYESGVYDGCSNQSSVIDHGVQAVGYGFDPSNGAYWIVRNSWGEEWGDAGYIKIARTAGRPAPCRLDPHNSEGDGCKDSPETITVCGECGILSDSSYPTGAYIPTAPTAADLH